MRLATLQLLLLLHESRAAIARSAYTTPGAPLEVLPQFAAADGTISINLDVYDYHGPTVSHLTRAFNGEQGGVVVNELTGPTIRVRPGEKLRVRLTNKLGKEACDMSAVKNTMKSVNSTSLHTHGLHVSPVAPGDDALTEVHPGESKEYIYDVPADHMGGTLYRRRDSNQKLLPTFRHGAADLD